jgi:hypothetical protein
MRAVFVVGLVGIGCAGADGADALLDVREASESECPAGGTVVITTEGESIICNGAKGNDGATGATGPQGEKGATGATGERGIIGPRGAAGDPGEMGATGVQGVAGDVGPKGDTGATGPTGASGAASEMGLPGEKGDTGATGPQGEPGEDGAFSEGLVSATLYCGAGLENVTGLRFNYWATIFADGTVWASAEIVDSFTATSSSRVYAATQNGALDASVELVRDAATPSNGGWWEISVNRQAIVVNIVYHDVDVANGQMTWELDSSSNGCVVNPVI